MKRIQFRLTAYTDPAGKWNEDAPNKGNEDNMFVDADLSNAAQGEFEADKVVALSDKGMLMVVADGMGGMNAGEVASKIAIDTVERCFSRENLSRHGLRTVKEREEYMENVVVEADSAIKAHAKANKECEGMGSTLIMAWLCQGQLSVTWCGDSRAYLFREPLGLRQVSKDHSYVQEQVDAGILTPDQAFDSPYGNIITRSLGDPEKKAQADSVTLPVYKGDILMLCSDGLSGVLRDREMSEIMARNRSSMRACREALWQAAENADWYDNVTAILCEIVEGDACPVEELEPEAGETVSRTGEPGSGVRQSSVVSFKVRKRTLRRLAATLAALAVLVALGWFVKAKFFAGDPCRDNLRGQLEELRERADGRKLLFYRDSIDRVLAMKNLDSLLVASLRDAVLEQDSALSCLEEMRKGASSGFTDYVKSWTDSLRHSALEGKKAVRAAKEFKNVLDRITGEIDELRNDGRLSDSLKERLTGFEKAVWDCASMEALDSKEEEWEELKKEFSRPESKPLFQRRDTGGKPVAAPSGSGKEDPQGGQERKPGLTRLPGGLVQVKQKQAEEADTGNAGLSKGITPVVVDTVGSE